MKKDSRVVDVPLTVVLERYNLLGTLERLANGLLRGKCPIHQGFHSGHFLVNPARNSWVCIGPCKRRGDGILLVQLIDHISRHRAVRKVQEWGQ